MRARVVDHATARRAALVATIWVPVAMIVAAEAAVVAVGTAGRHDLIVRWGGHVESGPWWDYAILVPLVGLPVIAGIGVVVARFTKVDGMNAWLPALVMGVTVFHTLGMGVGVVVLNASPLAPALPLAGGFGLGVAAAFLTWRVLPKETASPPVVESAGPLPLRPREVAAWTGRVQQPTRLLALLGTAAAVLLAVGLVLVTVGWLVWPLFVLPVMFLAVLLIVSEFVVTAGPDGFLARSVIGWPKLRVAAADIATAGVVQVDPLTEFGGLGVLWAIGPRRKGRWGILARRGPALEVVRHDGRSLVATIDDPATAASVLQNYAKETPWQPPQMPDPPLRSHGGTETGSCA